MRLSSPFIKLPLRFDAARLAQEALQFAETDWTYHPLRHKGNTALALVSADGEVNDRFLGEMRPTAALEECPYVLQVMASFGTVIGRARFMRLAHGADVPAHSDGNYSWRNRVRIHIPIITHADVIFSSVGNVDIHMAEGEAWIFDNWREHAVHNQSPVDRIHLVIDTVGTSRFWGLVNAGWKPGTPDNGWSNAVDFRAFMPDAVAPNLDFERFNAVPVRSPDEISNMLDELMSDLGNFRRSSPQLFEKAVDAIEEFKQDWRGYWALYWDATDAIPHYQLLAKQLKSRLQPLLQGATFDSNQANAYEVAAGWIAAATEKTVRAQGTNTGTAGVAPSMESPKSGLSLEEYVRQFGTPTFKQPVFIVAAPRSGSTMLFEALQKNKDLWTIGDESQREVESIPMLHPANRGFDSNELFAEDYTPQIGALLIDALMSRLQNAAGSGYLQTPAEYQPSSVRFLEKTPKNSLRIPFFRHMFPDAKFIFLHREAGPNLGSMMDAWLSGKFVTYDNLPGWDGPGWSLLLPPGWRSMRGRPLAEVVAWQWAQTNERIMSELAKLPREDWTRVSYESLLENPAETLQALCQFAGIPYGPRMQAIAEEAFPLSRYTLTKPDEEKWKRHANDIRSAAPLYSAVEKKISEFS
jgi:hypothetical protein